MKPLLVAVVATFALGGCLGAASTTCSDGIVCPAGKVCAPEGGGCALSEQLAACEQHADGTNCDTPEINTGVCLHRVCEATAWQPTVVIGSSSATETGITIGLPPNIFFSGPYLAGITVDHDGSLYFAVGSRVLRLDRQGFLTTIVGTGRTGFSGDGGPASSAQLGAIQGLAADGYGHLYIADMDNERIRRVDLVAGTISTVAGTGTPGFSGDSGPASQAALNAPQGVATDRYGNLVIADTGNHRIRRVDASTGQITTVAGTGTAGFSNDGGFATGAKLDLPLGIAVDSGGNIFFSDPNTYRVRKIDTAGVISTVAGNGTPGASDEGVVATSTSIDPAGIVLDRDGSLYVIDRNHAKVRRVDRTNGVITTAAGNGTPGDSGDGGAATSAQLIDVSGLALDDQDNLVIVTAFRLRRVDALTGVITTIAGTGNTAENDRVAGTTLELSLSGVVVDASGNVFASDLLGGRVFRIDAVTGLVTVIAGSPRASVIGVAGDGGSALEAQLWPATLAIDHAGNIFLYDFLGHTIRRIDATTGIITAIAGNGSQGYSGDGGPALEASLEAAASLAIDASDNIYVATGDYRVRRIDHQTQFISTVAGNGSDGFSGDGGPATAASIGNGPVDLALDDAGNLYISDPEHYRIRRVDHATQTMTTFAGNGTPYTPVGSGDGGSAILASMGGFSILGPLAIDVAVDRFGNVYVADKGSSRIRRIDVTTGIINSFAGGGTGGERGPASTAVLTQPTDISVLQDGDVYFLSGTFIRRIDGATGIITSVVGPIDPVGTGPTDHARLADPRAIAVGPWDASGKTLTVAASGSSVVELLRNGWLGAVAGRYPQDAPTEPWARLRDRNFGSVEGVAYDPAGTIYLTESSTSRVHAVTMVDPEAEADWTIAQLVGSAGPGWSDGPDNTAQLDHPTGLFLDPSTRTLFVADTGNHVIRAIDLDASTISTIAGTPYLWGSGGDGELATSAQLDAPKAVTRCANGDIFIADTGNNRVRRIDAQHRISTVLGDSSPSSSGEGAPARSFAVDSPAGVVCDRIGNVFVTSRTTVRMLIANDAGQVTGDGNVRTIYPRAYPPVFPATATSCLTGIAVVDDTTLQVADSCAGMLISLGREIVH